jgi:hypothetical protein
MWTAVSKGFEALLSYSPMALIIGVSSIILAVGFCTPTRLLRILGND